MSTSSGGMFYVPYAVCSAPLTELYASCDFGISLKMAEHPVSPFHSALQQPLGTVPLQRWKGQPSWLRMKQFFNAWMAIEGQWEIDSISKRFVISPQTIVFKSNQIKSLLLSHHHSTSALVSEILMSVLQTVQKNNRQFTYGQTVQKKKNNKQFTYGQTVQKNCTGAFTVLQTVQKKTTTAIYIWTDSAKKTTTAIYIWTDSAKKTTAIYIWTVHIYRLYRRQCAKYTYMHSVRLVYYRDILNYQRHIIHRMGTSTLCTVSIHNVVYT